MTDDVNGSKVDLDSFWVGSSAHLQPALDFAGNLHNLDHVRAAIEGNRAQIWPASEGTIVTEVKDFPTGRRMLNFWLAGGELGFLLEAEPIICEWAKEQGCEFAHILGRKGWSRKLPDYRHTANVLVKDLRHG